MTGQNLFVFDKSVFVYMAPQLRGIPPGEPQKSIGVRSTIETNSFVLYGFDFV